MRKVVLIAAVAVSLILLSLISHGTQLDRYTGICVRSGASYSILFNGSATVLIPQRLKIGEVYTVEGHMRKGRDGLIMQPKSLYRGGNVRLEEIRGVYWSWGNGRWYVFSRTGRIRLAKSLDVALADVVDIEGVQYGELFYPVRVADKGPVKNPIDGAPWKLRGVVLSDRTVWNGSERITVYPPHGVRLKLGSYVEVTGIVHVGTRVVVYSSNVTVLGQANRAPVGTGRIGSVEVGRCLVLRDGKSARLNCTDLRVYGLRARTGDVVRLEALNRGTSLICINCTVVRRRETLPNGICSWKEGELGKVSGIVEWVKRYRNGFGIANVSRGNCSILIKLSSSLNFNPYRGDTVTVYGLFKLYRGERAIQPFTERDVCYGRC
ncbi:MAG: hypothetical protein GXO14_05175 [Thermococci archaeon]|nr:hypothetical protein [Thermococci archaeon]